MQYEDHDPETGELVTAINRASLDPRNLFAGGSLASISGAIQALEDRLHMPDLGELLETKASLDHEDQYLNVTLYYDSGRTISGSFDLGSLL